MKKIIVSLLAAVMMLTLSSAVMAEEGSEHYSEKYFFYDKEITVGPAEIIHETGAVTDESPEWVYEYIIPREGRYYVSVSDLRPGTSIRLSAVDQFGNESFEEEEPGITLEAKKDDTFTIRIAQSSGSTDFTLSIGVQRETIPVDSDVSFINASTEFLHQRDFYSYTAPKSGNYIVIIDSTNDNIKTYDVILHNNSGIANTEESTEKWVKEIHFEAGEEYIIRCAQAKRFGKYTITIGMSRDLIDESSEAEWQRIETSYLKELIAIKEFYDTEDGYTIDNGN